MTELVDGARYRGHHFNNRGTVEGVLVPKGKTQYEKENERTLLKDDGVGHYVDPSTLVPVFKPGDRVEYIRDSVPKGRTGTVVASPYEPSFQVMVRWDNGAKNFITPLVQNLRPLKRKAAKEPTVRARVLDEAKRITATDRNSSYGEPEDNFARIAGFWNVYLQDKLKPGAEISAGDTAALIIMVKLAREMNAPIEDNKVDIAGYAACWAEVDAKKGN